MIAGKPKWTEEHTQIAKRFEAAIAKTPRDQWIRYPSYSAYIKALREKTS